MANVSKLTLPNNNTYDIKDTVSEFGGTNLLKYSAWGAAMRNGMLYESNTRDIDYNKIWNLDYKVVEIDYGISNYNLGSLNASGLNDKIIPKDTTLCFSIPIYENTLNGDFTFTPMCIRLGNSGYGTELSIPVGQTGLYTESFLVNEDCRGFFLQGIDTSTATSGSIVLGPPKIEIGNKPTDWTPCLEDLVVYDYEQLTFFNYYPALM